MMPLPRLAALSAACALTAALATPALALNPQPLPPGIYLPGHRPPQFQHDMFINPQPLPPGRKNPAAAFGVFSPHPVMPLPHCHSAPPHLDPRLAPPPRVCS